jgi:hypothetical protein
MPIVDGLTATKMIREFESSPTYSSHAKVSRRKGGGVPIFAVSASLVEELMESYIETGFDGWILKPIDFKRLNTLLKGIDDEETRHSCLHEPGKWERGGWLRQPDVPRPLTDISEETTPKAEDQKKEIGDSVAGGSTLAEAGAPALEPVPEKPQEETS